MTFWRRQREPELGSELRASRPEARDELVRDLAGRIEARPAEPRRRAAPRLVLAGALVAGMLASAGVMGGFSYAATAARSVASDVKNLLVAGGGDQVESNLSAGGDQYQPGYAWGDPNHGHDGPPGLTREGRELAPPLVARCENGTARVVVRLVLDEQADLTVTVRGKAGKKLPLVQPDGSSDESLTYRVLVPRALKLTLEIPCKFLTNGKTHRVELLATDPGGAKTKLVVPFRAQTATD